MKTEQEKYFEAYSKAIDCFKALNELAPQTRDQLLQELFLIAIENNLIQRTSDNNRTGRS